MKCTLGNLLWAPGWGGLALRPATLPTTPAIAAAQTSTEGDQAVKEEEKPIVPKPEVIDLCSSPERGGTDSHQRLGSSHSIHPVYKVDRAPKAASTLATPIAQLVPSLHAPPPKPRGRHTKSARHLAARVSDVYGKPYGPDEIEAMVSALVALSVYANDAHLRLSHYPKFPEPF